MMSMLNSQEGEGQSQDGLSNFMHRLTSLFRDGKVNGTNVCLPAICKPLGQTFCTAGPLHSIIKGDAGNSSFQ